MHVRIWIKRILDVKAIFGRFISLEAGCSELGDKFGNSISVFSSPFWEMCTLVVYIYKNKTVKKQTHLIFLFEYVDLYIDFYLT